MKYFTKEFWLRLQDIANSPAHDEEWERLLVAYRDELAGLAERIPPATMVFFAEANVHDGQLLEFRVSQPTARTPWDGAAETEHPVDVQLVVQEEGGASTWRLKYSNVRRVNVDYPSTSPLFPMGGEGFGDWGYHELTNAGGGLLRHEVLFATGTSLLVEFGTVDVERVTS